MDESNAPPPAPIKLLTRIAEELGLASIYHSSTDVKLLCLQRFVRLFAYGGATLILVSYLSALSISKAYIGLFMALTLAGDVIISFVLTIFADGLGRRTILAAGALLMAGSGVVFALSGDFWVLLAAAIFGVISPSGNEIGPFRAIEESTLAHLTPAALRGDVFAWYSLIGTAGAACGLMTCGWVVHSLEVQEGVDGGADIHAYRIVFFAYAVAGGVKFLLAMALSKAVEADRPAKTVQNGHGSETTPLIGAEEAARPKVSWSDVMPKISKESRVIVVNLCLLFALDSFGSGLAPLSWITYFFKSKFDVQSGALGSLFFTTAIIAAASMLVASSLAKRIGNVKTMVFTHVPSAIALALIPFPSSLPLAMALLIIRSCTQSMDVAPRSAFLAAVVLPSERTAVMGVINVVKTAAQSLGPLITGVLAGRDLFWVAFVLAGSCKVAYDMGVLAMFLGIKPREEEVAEDAARAAEVSDEDV